MFTRSLRLLAALCLFGAFDAVAAILPSTTDLWDISQGSTVTATSGLDAGFDGRDMFGGTFSPAEPGNTVYADGQPDGFVHYVEWQTAVPVNVSSFALFAAGDGPDANNEREFAQFTLKAKSSPLATNYDLTIYTLVVTNHPYNYVDPVNDALVATNFTPVTAQFFRAEFTQYTAGRGYDGPRIIELDGFGTNAPSILSGPTNQVLQAGMNATFSVSAIGPPPLIYQWQENGTNISGTINVTATNATLVLSNVQSNLSGNQYSVIVSNLYGSTNSPAGSLSIVGFRIHYVDVNGANPDFPFSSWVTAATNIQDAVAAALPGDLILVTNGVYQYGEAGPDESDINRVLISVPLTLQSVNGPGVTTIVGNPAFDFSAVRCVSLTDGDTLTGFTLTLGGTRRNFHGPPPGEDVGGGVRTLTGNAVVSNCIMVENGSVSGGGAGCASGYGPATMTLYNCVLNSNTFSGYGGGAYECTLVNCQLNGNSAPTSGFSHGGGGAYCSLTNCTIANNSDLDGGGGAYICRLVNCTVVSNLDSVTGGGAFDSVLNNCIVTGNTSPGGSNFDEATGDVLNFCCTTPMPTNGIGNITYDPLFVNPAAGDFHLQSNSPCINAGNNTYVNTTTDLDGNPRISGGTVDIGAYEFQNPASIISYAWLQQYNLPTDGSADFLDPDHDGLNNWQEWLAGTNPTNASSILQMLSPRSTNNPPGLVVTWQSAPNITYYLQRATNLSLQPAFQPLATNLPGQAGTTSYTDTNAPAPGPYFYRVGVQHP